MTLRLVSFLPPALQDIRNVHDWYEKQKTGLGKEFTAMVILKVEELQKEMVVFHLFFQNVRCVQLKKFPYTIFYFIKEETNQVIVVAVLGNKQDQLTIVRNRIET